MSILGAIMGNMASMGQYGINWGNIGAIWHQLGQYGINGAIMGQYGTFGAIKQ